MAPTTISRATWTDDDGSGTTGTIVNNARIQADIYDKIDALFSGAATFEFGGAVKVDGVTDLAGYKETLTALGNVSGGTVTFNLALGSAWSLRLTANAGTTTLSNIPASGRFASFVAKVTGDGTARTWTWFDSTVKWDGGVAPTRTSTNNKVDWYMFVTVDGGTTWGGFIVGQNRDA